MQQVGAGRHRAQSPGAGVFGKDTPVSVITTARVNDYRLHRASTKSPLGRLLSSTTINRDARYCAGRLGGL
jgi:hypothetical protein